MDRERERGEEKKIIQHVRTEKLSSVESTYDEENNNLQMLDHVFTPVMSASAGRHKD
jgi:hypothetical protein